ncbi:peptide chain release factor N(5)-glutamine methyltransferase [Patescibacteria group bacterium]
MTIKEIIIKYSANLIGKSASPILDIELLLAKTINQAKEYLYKNPDKKLTTKQLKFFLNLVERRSKGEPIAYILGYQEFFNLKLKVNKNVLIPRPETELLVEQVLEFTKTNKIKSIADIGTGSGAIIIALAKNLKAEFYGSDISSQALALAKENAKTHKVKIKFYKGNLLEPLKSDQLDIIVANLPYLTTKELNNPSIQHEPKLALAGGKDGLNIFIEFFQHLKQYNQRPKLILLEIGYKQAQSLKNISKIYLPKYKYKVKKDLCGLDRIAIITQK